MTGTGSERTATARQLAIGRFWRSLCLARSQCLISSSYLHGLLHRHLYCLTLQMTPMTCLQFKRKCLLPKLSFVFHFFCRFLISIIYFFTWSKQIISNHRRHFSIAFMGKSVSTNAAGVGTTYDVTAGDYCSAHGLEMKYVTSNTVLLSLSPWRLKAD